MNNNTTNGPLTHHNDQHIQIRKDLFDLCAYDKAEFNQKVNGKGNPIKDEPNQACMAMILRLLETLAKGNKEAWITLSYSTIVSLLYNIYGESTVRKSIAALLARGYIQCRQETKASVPSYALNIPVLQAALDQQEKEKGVKSNSQGVKSNSQGVKSNSQGVKSNSLRVSNLTPYKKEDKITHKKDSKNDASAREVNVSTGEGSSHSFIRSSLNFSSSSSQEETKPEAKTSVAFSPEAEQVYQFAEKLNLVALKRDENHRDSCNKLVEKGVTTFEKLESLKKYCKQQPFYADKTLNLKNLINALSGWLQTQEQKLAPTPTVTTSKPYGKDLKAGYSNMILSCLKKEIARGWQVAKAEGFLDNTTTDSDIADAIHKWSRAYKDAEHAEEHLKRVKQIQRECGIDNDSFFGLLYNVKDDTDYSGIKSMHSFFEILDKKLGRNQRPMTRTKAS